MRLSQCTEATDGTLVNGDCEFDSLSTDTRQIGPGELFVALRGKNYDAHDFLYLAVDAGACGLVVERADEAISLPQLVVQDTTAALGAISTVKRSFFSGVLVAITGSSGKTTVKGMLTAILSVRGRVKATRGNFNNHIGVPLTLMRLEANDSFAVIEMGTSGIGEIRYLANLAKPAVALVNNVMAAHLAGFGSLASIAQEKAQIYSPLPAEGTAVINLDDNFAPYFIEQTKAVERLGFCVGEPDPEFADIMPCIYAATVTEDALGRAVFSLVHGEEDIVIELAVLGRHNVSNALAAAACALAAGASLQDIQQGLAQYTGDAGRMQVRSASNGAALIDDSYNANPGSLRAAIDYLGTRPQTSVLVLGDLAELGEDAARIHGELGVYAKQAGVAFLFTCGQMAQFAAEAFGSDAEHFETQAQLIEALQQKLQPDAVVLVKGSHSSRMENIVAAIADSAQQDQTGEQK